MDIILGGELLGNHPFTMTASQDRSSNPLWNEEKDNIYLEPGAQFSIFLGLQSTTD